MIPTDLSTNALKEGYSEVFSWSFPPILIMVGSMMVFTCLIKFFQNFIHKDFPDTTKKVILLLTGAVMMFWGITNLRFEGTSIIISLIIAGIFGSLHTVAKQR